MMEKNESLKTRLKNWLKQEPEKTKESFQLCDFTEIGFAKRNRDEHINLYKKQDIFENEIKATEQKCRFRIFIEKITGFEKFTKIKKKTKQNLDDEKFTIFNYDLFCAAYDDYDCYTAWKKDQLYLDSLHLRRV